MVSPFRKIRTGERNLDAVQDNVGEALEPIIQNPLVNGVLIPNVAIPATGSFVKVAHGLNRVPIDWFPMAADGSARIWRAAEDTKLFINVQASAPVTCSLWVF